MDGEGCVIAGPSGVRRQAYLRFPPPPPFPPDEYSYAYYEGKKVPVPGTSKNPRHSYITRYGTQENLYEEIGQMRLEEEVRYVHSKHLQVLDELNLSMEAMLMPTPPQSELTTEALMSPAACSVDSGFSSSSTGTNSLGRPNSSIKKKSPHSFWKKLPGLGSTSTLVKPSPDEPRCNSGSWEESPHEQSRRSSCSDVDLSSGDESKYGFGSRGLDGKGRPGSKRGIWRKSSPEPGGGSTSIGRLSKLFSKKKSLQAIEAEPRGKMPLLPEEEECNMTHRRVMSPSLPPPPHNLSPQQIKTRHIVEAIVQSENSYLATLRKLVHEYKKPLEESSPALLSPGKIQTIFHRLPEILQCHTLFSIALAEAVANWDQEHRIGDVFVASFSKAVVLDIYSDFINNFSLAMDVVRTETKKKPALADFFKTRQNSSHDRLSFFGLMVKPVQRFPQFILFLQDLLQNTGHGHPERMVLQLALTKLESLAELLNERKREAEQAQAFRQMMRCVSAKMPTAAQHKYLIRHDDVTQLEVNSCGMISKLKNRRLLLLNDQLVCVALSSKEENVNSQLRLTFKWSCSINDVQVIESSGSPTLSRLLTPNGSLASTNSSGTSDSLCMEMSQLMHDYQVISRIHDLTHNLKGQYQEVNADITRSLLDNIQREIQRKDEQMAWLDSCCLQVMLRGKDETYTFQMNSQEARKEWITELRLARLALDTNNSPSWEVPEQELRPSTKMPLFVAAHPVYTSDPTSEVMCGCYYSTTCGKTGYLWVCTYDGNDSHISIAQTWQTSLKALTQLQITGTKVTAMEYVRSMDTVWLGTANNRLLMYSVCEIERPELSNSLQIDGDVISIKVHCDNVFISLMTGRLLMFRRHSVVTEPEEICLGSDPVACILPINLSIYAATGKTITVISAITGELQKTFTVQHDHLGGHISLMAHSGVGLWLALANSSTICLYHTETFKHLQDINVASNVVRITRCQGPVTVTGLMAVKGLLWVGTDSGLALTVPLPRLEGVPIISGRVNVSYHGHSGPLSLLLPLHDPPTVHKRPASKALASDVYGLYGQLMYVKDYEETEAEWTQVSRPDTMSRNESKREHTLITITGGQGYINYQQCCYKNITNLAHVVIWEMKL
ncbi:rho guanine nucleotide exchange factor 10-like [Cimex lectularius]|uniref:DH domain-containing protein n=1 Tax=Cimex lectularius TaxID=79782 RepID=A0A8I6RE89_CIMLE|nr:rho guanine nucleotide exchange factor 10-like [Cimex lectularius]